MEEIELELTYLAKVLPGSINLSDGIIMVDCYIPSDPSVHSRLRIRKKGSAYTLTKKIQINEGDASAHTEFTVGLDESEYKELVGKSSKCVEKTRYEVRIDGYDAEVDIFSGELSGLVLIDFEFSSVQNMEAFEVPECCLADVTQEDFIAGGILAGKKYSDIRGNLKKFEYKKIEV